MDNKMVKSALWLTPENPSENACRTTIEQPKVLLQDWVL